VADAASRRTLVLAVAAGLGLIGFGLWLVVATLGDLLTREAPAADETRRAADPRAVEVTIYYVSADGTDLVPVVRELAAVATTAEMARRVVEAQIAAPPAGRVSPIPAGTTLRAVFLTGRGEAFVDLGGAIATGHPGGSLHEALTVYALVNALTTNVADVSSVQILVEGREVDTLAGHLDVREPLRRAEAWIAKGQ
jgi:spore germination protein GerM